MSHISRDIKDFNDALDDELINALDRAIFDELMNEQDFPDRELVMRVWDATLANGVRNVFDGPLLYKIIKCKDEK
jgi:hypothetical protein